MVKQIKKIILAATMLLVTNVTWAYDFQVDGIYYNITSNTVPYTVEVTYRDANLNSYSGNITIPNTVVYNRKTYSVTSIGEKAFQECTTLLSLNIPNSITSIFISNSLYSYGPFAGCDSLTAINVLAGNTHFSSVNGVLFNYNQDTLIAYPANKADSNYTIPISVIKIEKWAFCDCNNLISLNITKNVSCLGDYAFAGCYALTTVNFNADSCTYANIPNSPFYVCPNFRFLSIGTDVKTIPNTFSQCENIEHVIFNASNCNSRYGASKIRTLTIGRSVRSLPSNAFYGCDSLCTINYNADSCMSFGSRSFSNLSHVQTLTIGNNVKIIPPLAFQDFTGLTTVSIPDSVTSIGACAFSHCTALDSVTIGNSVVYIDSSAFGRCTNLRTVILGNSLSIIGSYAFYNTWLPSITLPSSLTTIGNYAFSNTRLTSITIPNSTTSIGKSAFYNSNRLSTVTIGNSVETIGEYAFYNTGLTSLTIPASVRKIEKCAFQNCTNLASLTINDTVLYIERNVFTGCSSLQRTNFMGTIGQWCKIKFEYYTSNPICFSHNLYNNNSLVTNLVIPSTVDTINAFAFYGDTALISLTIPNSVINFKEKAFYGCTHLTKTNYMGTTAQWSNIDFDLANANPISYTNNFYINDTLITNLFIPNAVDTIRAFAFYGDTAIKTAIISNSTTNIEKYAFYNCTGLTSLTTSDSLQQIGDYAFCFTALDTLTIGKRVRNIGMMAFANCGNLRMVKYNAINCSFTQNYELFGYADTSLTTIEIADDVQRIPNYIFSKNSKITTLNIPNSVVSIGDYAFAYCDGLSSVIVGKNLNSIGNYAFYGCSGMRQIKFLGLIPPVYSAQTYGNVPQNTSILVPCGKLSWYTTSLQNTFPYISETFTFSVSISSNDTTYGTVQVIGNPNCSNPQITIIATPNNGLYFSHWSDGDSNARRTITITQDTTIIAYFTQQSQSWYNFNVISEDTNKGTIQIITQPSRVNPQAIIVALPNTGYTFTRWSDGNTQNPRALTVTQDTILIAFFTSNHGIAEAGSDNIIIRTANGNIILEGITNERVYISDVLGRVVFNSSVNENSEIAVRNRGVYFVKVGNRMAKKVVVIR